MNIKFNRFLTVIIIILICVISYLYFYKQKQSEFEIPEFDKNAISEKLEVPESLNLNSFKVSDGYEFQICSNLKLGENNELPIYFYSKETNDVYIKIKVYDKESNKCLLETGIIKPGQSLRNIYFNQNVKNKEVLIKVLSYNPSNYYSRGTVKLNAKIQ